MAPLAEANSVHANRARRNGQGGALNIHIWAPAFTGFGGGITSFSRALASTLGSLGHDLRLFGQADSSGEFDGIPLRGTGHHTTLSQRHAFALRVLASVGRQRPDHIISAHVNFGPAAQIAKRAFGTSYTLVAHGIDIHAGLPDATVASLRAADGIVAVSEWTRLRVLDLGGIDPAVVTILPNTFEENRFTVAPPSEALRRRYGIEAGERVVLTVARLAPHERYKGYDRVVRSLSLIREIAGPVRYIVVGEGQDKERLEAISSVLGVRRMVTLAGFVSDEELADHYRLADVFAMPSTGEGFGIVFLEAMGCGTPVVAGNRDGSVDALAKGRLGCLVDPNDIEAIASGIGSMLMGRGLPLWFDRQALRAAAVKRFGRAAFRQAVIDAFRFLK